MKATILLEKQHRKVEALFKALETNRSKAQETVEELATNLAAHAAIEEEIFYPAVKKADKEMVLESYEEHQLMAFALRRMVGTEPEDDSFPAKVKALKDVVEHHVREEESSVLPGMRERLDEKRRAELGRRFAASRAQHLGDRPGHPSRSELLLQARNAGLAGARGMSKEELARELLKTS